MRFALLGDHPDGRSFAQALTATGRHSVVDFPHRDVEEVLADPSIEACIVAVSMAQRLDVARRVLQSERHAAVVHPVDFKPDGAHELNLLQGDVHQALLPLIPQALDPRVQSLKQAGDPSQLIDAHFSAPNEVLLAIDERRKHPVFPGWTLLRNLRGELAEISAFARTERVATNEPLVASGTFADGTVFRADYRTAGTEPTAEIRIGEAGLVIRPTDPETAASWRQVVAEFEAEVERLKNAPKAEPGAGATERPDARLSWKDAVRALELDDAAARSLAKRRAVLLEYQEVNEEVGFKGTMTLLGCGMLWMLLVVLCIAAWYPPLFWVTLPILIVFLALQLFRWVLPTKT